MQWQKAVLANNEENNSPASARAGCKMFGSSATNLAGKGAGLSNSFDKGDTKGTGWRFTSSFGF